MSNKRHKENNQLSLTLELPMQATQAHSANAPVQQRSASIVAFASRQTQSPSFRERVIQDLMKTRVMVAE
jgi:hypothetical protein